MKKRTIIKTFICMLAVSTLFFACKKDKSSPAVKSQRITSISDGNQATLFEYDGQGRISRLYYDASNSLRFTYAPAGVNMERLGSGDVPDPYRKTDFTIVNGRVSSGTEYLPDKRTRKFDYRYDDQNKLVVLYVQLKYDGTTYESHHYQLAYDAQNNVEAINFVRKDNGGNDNSDSIYIAKTWYDNKFITWNDLGFGYFGVAAFGQQHLGYGITVPFYMGGSIYPADHALKSETTDQYYWNPLTKKWVFQSTNSYTRPESDYEYSASGRLIKYAGSTIEWE